MSNKKNIVPKLFCCKRIMIIAAIWLLGVSVVGSTVAFIVVHTQSVVNEFEPSNVSCEVTEDFDGSVKQNVNVTNTGDADAWIRVKLVTYRVNDEGQHIGGTAIVPNFTPGNGWVLHDGFYYYTSLVAPNKQPSSNLITSIILSTYSDADGGKQAIEVIAEAIQAKGTDANKNEAVKLAWGIDPATLK